jgi:cyclopropane fatty-acyl-phospholipid synthase-like methyltransferase
MFSSRAHLFRADVGACSVHRHHGHTFANFVEPGSLDGVERVQRDHYEREDERYAAQSASNPAFMRAFVEAYARGKGLKNKDALLASRLRALPLERGGLVLEVGSNDGRFLNAAVAMHGCAGIGIDLAAAAVRRALEHRPQGLDVEFHVGRASALPFVDGCFDAIISMDVFEHLGHDGVRATLRECARVLKPGGVLLAYVVSRQDRFTLHDTWRQISCGRLGHDDQDGHVWENFLTPDEFRQGARAAGLSTRWLRAHHAFWTLFASEELGDRLPRWALSVLDLFDRPLVRCEHGNGFLAEAIKDAL